MLPASPSLVKPLLSCPRSSGYVILSPGLFCVPSFCKFSYYVCRLIDSLIVYESFPVLCACLEIRRQFVDPKTELRFSGFVASTFTRSLAGPLFVFPLKLTLAASLTLSPTFLPICPFTP